MGGCRRHLERGLSHNTAASQGQPEWAGGTENGPVLVFRRLSAATVKGWSRDLLPSTFWAGGGLSSAGGNTWALGWADEGYRKRSKTLVLESASYQSWGGLGHVWQKGQWNCP